MKLLFQRKLDLGNDICSFTFLPVEPVEWIAGQSIRLELPGVYGSEERRFSISAAPYEEVITITTRISDSTFKQTLAALPSGTPVDGYDIRGDFVWTDAPKIFVASGIGITPYYSMLKQRAHQQKSLDVTVLHAAQVGESLFASDFRHWQESRLGFRYIPVLQQRITAQAIVAVGLADKIIYLSGPSKMVDQVGTDLQDIYKVSDSHLRRDWFTGRLDKE